MCFSMTFFFQLMIWLVIVGAIYAIIRIIVPAVLTQFGGPGSLLAQVVNIVLWAALLIVVLYIIWGLVDCLLGSGGLHLPGPNRR